MAQPRRPKTAHWVVSFASTFDAMEAEALAGAAGMPGRIIPLPVEVTAECGLAWAMPATDEARHRFEAAVAGAVTPAGYHLLML